MKAIPINGIYHTEMHSDSMTDKQMMQYNKCNNISIRTNNAKVSSH